MKIASIVPYKIFPALTGGEKGVYFFIKYLSHYTDIVCFTVDENLQVESGSLSILNILGSTKNKFRYINPFLFLKIKKECKKQNINHVIIEHPYYGWLGYLLKKFTHLKLIIHSHNIESDRFKSMNKWWWGIMYVYEKFVYRNADMNFFITREDKDIAVKQFHLKESKCNVVTYGIENDESPTIQEKQTAKEFLCKELGVDVNTKLVLFNGTLDYLPNRDGLDKILYQINPILQKEMKISYRIIICGMRLPEYYNSLKEFTGSNIIYKGFVEDIGLYFKASDIFINPIIDGGGIKTKLVEALAASTRAVSFVSGAYGIPVSVTGKYLKIVSNDDYVAFSHSIIEQCSAHDELISNKFFEHFYWGNITKGVFDRIGVL